MLSFILIWWNDIVPLINVAMHCKMYCNLTLKYEQIMMFLFIDLMGNVRYFSAGSFFDSWRSLLLISISIYCYKCPYRSKGSFLILMWVIWELFSFLTAVYAWNHKIIPSACQMPCNWAVVNHQTTKQPHIHTTAIHYCILTLCGFETMFRVFNRKLYVFLCINNFFLVVQKSQMIIFFCVQMHCK